MDISQLSGQFLGQYELRELLGIGGMGAVYRGYQAALQREVAIKIILPSLTSESDYLERFRREAQMAARLEHAHIVSVYDYGTHESINFIVMRLLQGGSLAQRLEEQSALSLPEISNILDQLARALDHAHNKGVIHRDIKTSNVMYDDLQNTYLVDFGIAKPLHAASANDLTPIDTLIGTPAYMAPELWRDGTASKATDLYALGILIYVTLTSKLPFESVHPMYKHLTEEPPPITRFRPDLPDGLQLVMNKALAKSPEHRYPSARAFARAFKRTVRRSKNSENRKHVSSLNTETKQTVVYAESTSTLVLPDARSGEVVTLAKQLTNQSKIIGILLIVILSIFLGIVSFNAATQSADTSNFNAVLQETVIPTSIASLVIVLPLNGTHIPSHIPTIIPTDTTTPTIIPSLTSTPTTTVIPSATSTITPSRTNTPTDTATPSATATSTYTTTPSPTPTIISETVSLSGNLTENQSSVEHLFSWNAGDIVSIHVTTDDFDPYLSLSRSTGEIVADNDDCQRTLNSCINYFELPVDDIFSLRVESFNMASVGAYQVDIAYIHRCSEGEPIAIVNSNQTSINLRSGASTSYPVIATVPNQMCLEIIGRNSSYNWLKIRTDSMRSGWINRGIVQVFGDLSVVPFASE
jgi:serine/threonine protein kinase